MAPSAELEEALAAVSGLEASRRTRVEVRLDTRDEAYVIYLSRRRGQQPDELSSSGT